MFILHNVVKIIVFDQTRNSTQLQESLNWIDTARFFNDYSEKIYSWWSYRNKDWKKSNRGRRLDHIWVTPNLKDKLASYDSFIQARSWQRPSDHVPIMLKLDV